MNPDENQNTVSETPASNPSEPTLPETPTEQTPNTTQPTITNSPLSSTPPHKSRKKTLIIVIIVVIILAGGSAFAVYHYEHAKTTKAAVITNPSGAIKSSAKAPATPAVTNTWTGKDNNYNWDDANNWALGIPTNGQNLEINVADVTQPTDQYGTTSFAFQDNIPNLTINKLMIDGQVSSILFDIKGDALSISNGIEDTITTTASGAGVPQVQIDNLINLTGNQTVETSGSNSLTFYNTGETINIGDNTVQFNSTGTSQINLQGEVNGTGEIYLPANSVDSSAGLSFSNSSPNFDGRVVIGSGNNISISNQDAQTGGYGKLDAFGNSSITIMNGGALQVFAAGITNFTVNNPISVSGSGITNSDGSITGAISACVTSLEQGCGANENIIFTGPVKLLGNTQIGESTPTSAGANNTTVNYTFGNLDKNGYTLNTITGYHYTANF